MPRPGPRPYECVRRAWHSDRHQPMRGSLIQEIFRVANELHSPATRKNKEWQEKLPFVVLKAEEIMYSKAKSEAEYMDLKTLRDRANNAIDTIIRKDETMESGDLLQPCIEAVLNLGCVPKKTSRSQRHSNPGGYLGSTIKDVITAPLKLPDDDDNDDDNKSCIGSSSHRLPPSTPPDHLSASQFASPFIKPTSVNPGIPKAMFVNPDASQQQEDFFTIAHSNPPYICKHSLLPCQHRMPNPMDAYICPALGRVYPLYYSHNQPQTGAQLSYQIPQDLHCSMVTPMMPDVLSLDNVAAGHMQNIPGSRSTMDSLKQVSNFIEASENPPHICCDLSLRLGLPSSPSFGAEDAWNNEVEDVGSSSSCDESKFYDRSPKRTRAWNLES